MTRPERIVKGLYWDRAWSLVEGCTPVSAGCRHCWSAAQTHLRSRQSNRQVRVRYVGLTDASGCFNGMIRIGDLEAPLRRQVPTTYAVWNDLFHPDVPFDCISRAFDVMCSGRWHTYLVLTKRPERIQRWLSWVWATWPGDSPLSIALDVEGRIAKNIWLGVSVEDQTTAAERLPYLVDLAAGGWHTFVSAEPLLGPLSVSSSLGAPDKTIEWMICGCESGPQRRIEADWWRWARALKNECLQAAVPFFLKQGPDERGRVVQMPELDGRMWDEMPESMGGRLERDTNKGNAASTSRNGE